MLGQTTQLFALADLDYHHERVAAQFPRSARPFHLRWPAGLISPNRRRPRQISTPRPSPHHATSIS